jgi:uncharacterized protein YjiS (DUF1127 family)
MEVKISSQDDIRAPAAAIVLMGGLRLLQGFVGALATAAVALQRRVMAAACRRRVERELQSLSDVMLKDIGIARSEIPWIAVTQAKRTRAQGGTEQGQLEAHDRRHRRNRTFRPSLIPSQQGKV